MDGKSLNLTEDLLSKLKEIIPGAFTENKINIEQLRQLLGESITNDSERYQLNWAGKSEAFKVIQTPTSATLSPIQEDSIDWDLTDNVFIEGENLEALKVLQKAYYGRIKGIYIDPPYNTGSDSFIYPDKFSETKEDYLRRIGEKDNHGYLMKEGFFKPNRKENGQFHSNWLSMMLPRLFLARNLLREDGIIFVSIDENELSNLKLLMDEVFGEENFIDIFSWAKSETPANLSKKSKKIVEYVLCYQKIRNNEKFKGIKKSSQSSNGLLNQTNPVGNLNFPANTVSTSIQDGIIRKGLYGTDSYDIELLEDTEVCKGMFIKPVILKAKFKWSQNKLYKELEKGTKINIPTIKLSPSYEKLAYDEEVPPNLINSKVGVGTNENAGTALEKLFGAKIFDFPKPPSLIKYLFNFSDDPNGIFLDFFAGSGATAQAILEMNQADGGKRKYICIQIPEQIEPGTMAYTKGFRTIADITRNRLQLLHKKLKSNAEQSATTSLDVGFRFFKLTPSNFKFWRGDIIKNEQALVQQLSMFTKSQKDKVRTIDMLWELMIKSGIPLNTKIEQLAVGDTFIYAVQDRKFMYVLERMNEIILEQILLIKPVTVIFLDTLFNNADSLKTNIQLKLADAGIDFKSA